MAIRKMLVADDIESNRLLLGELFRDDYEILEAGNGNEALEMIQSHKNDLTIILNVIDLHLHNQHLECMLEQQAKKIKQSTSLLIDSLSTVVEFRNLESGEHIRQIRKYTTILLEALAEEYQITPQKIESIANASAMHDIGKIVIPDSILLKPGRLTEEEFAIMKTHTVRGCEILDQLAIADEGDYKYYYEICRHHHERWDGKGYPDGLKGDEISIWAQVVSLADVYDALTSKRVYKNALSHERAVEMILNNECGVFNPRMMEKFVLYQDLFKIKQPDPTDQTS